LGAAAKKDAASYLGEKFPGHGEPKSAARMAYRRDEDMQERFFAAFTAKNHSYLTGTPEYDSLSVREKFQVLGYAHNQGAGGARAWLKTGEVRRDGFGTAATKYSTELAKAYGSQNTVGMQKGGLVNTILEPKETVLLPGDPNMGRAMALNEMVPRFGFQKGGMVDVTMADVKPQPASLASGGGGEDTGEEAKPAGGKGQQAVLKAAEANVGLMKGIPEQCANSTRAVLKAAGHPDASKTTSKGDLDPAGLQYNGPGFAASFAGSDMGSVTKDYKSTKPGDIVLWKGTYGVNKWS
jgi:hypothetical protein